MSKSIHVEPFTFFQKLLVVIGTLAVLGALWYFTQGRADTTIGLTLTTNTALESGLVAHWTFDGGYVSGNILYDRVGAKEATLATSSEILYAYSTTTYTSNTSTTFNTSATAVSVTVEAWGAGGGGGGNGFFESSGGGGGGGGEYAKINAYSVSASTGYTVVVGNGGSGGTSGGAGGDSYFNTVGTLLANGGGGGGRAGSSGGTGGTGGVGDVTYSGGSGGNPGADDTGGGSSAGTGANGADGTTSAGGTAPTGGGNGGNPGGSSGSTPGGGGGGDDAGTFGTASGGAGADGKMVIVEKRTNGTLEIAPEADFGPIGQAYNVQGTGDYITVGNVGSGIQTLAFWFKTASSTQHLIDLNGTAYVWLNGGTLTATGITSPTTYVDGVGTTTVPVDDNWHHVIITTSSGINVSDMDIGRVTGQGIADASFDDVRMYSRILSADNIVRLYALGNTTRIATNVLTNPALEIGLLAHWTFENSMPAYYTATERVYPSRGSAGYVATSTQTTSLVTAFSDLITGSLEYDSTNQVVYAGTVDEAVPIIYPYYGDVYYCRPNGDGDGDGLCETGEWTMSYSGSGGAGYVALLHDPIHNVMYKGRYNTLNSDAYIQVCEPGADGVCAQAEWGNTYNWGPVDSIYSFGMDTTNSVIYVGGGNDVGEDRIAYCSLDTISVCGSGDWADSYTGGTRTNVANIIFDATHEALYAGMRGETTNKDLVLMCRPSVDGDADGICESGEWSQSFASTSQGVVGMGLDTKRSVVYIGTGIENGSATAEAYYCDTSAQANGVCDASSEWNLAFTGSNPAVSAFAYGENIDVLMLGEGDLNDGQYADTHTCAPAHSGDGDGVCEPGEWTQVYNDTVAEAAYDATYDPKNRTFYWGRGSIEVGSPRHADVLATVFNSTVPVGLGMIGQGVTMNTSQAGALYSQYLSVADATTTMKTVAFWVSVEDLASQLLMQINASDKIETNGSGTVLATSFPAATVYVDGTVGGALSDSGWHHVLVTDTTGVAPSGMTIGKATLSASFDDVRLYNRVLSTSEITRLHSLGNTFK